MREIIIKIEAPGTRYSGAFGRKLKAKITTINKIKELKNIHFPCLPASIDMDTGDSQ
jgi:hypothetical protein